MANETNDQLDDLIRKLNDTSDDGDNSELPAVCQALAEMTVSAIIDDDDNEHPLKTEVDQMLGLFQRENWPREELIRPQPGAVGHPIRNFWRLQLLLWNATSHQDHRLEIAIRLDENPGDLWKWCQEVKRDVLDTWSTAKVAVNLRKAAEKLREAPPTIPFRFEGNYIRLNEYARVHLGSTEMRMLRSLIKADGNEMTHEDLENAGVKNIKDVVSRLNRKLSAQGEGIISLTNVFGSVTLNF